MNLTEIIFNQNMLKIFSTTKETYEEKEKEVKKYIGGMDATTFWGIVTIILITLIIFFFWGETTMPTVASSHIESQMNDG